MRSHPLQQVSVDPEYKYLWYDLSEKFTTILCDHYGYTDDHLVGKLVNIALSDRFPIPDDN